MSATIGRSVLCRTTVSHDPGPDGRCRDCGEPVTASSVVCEQRAGFSVPDDEVQP